MPLPLGQMRHRFNIQRVTEDQSDTGQLMQTWQTIDTRWGSLQNLSGSKTIIAGQMATIETDRVIMRYYPLTSADRLVLDNRIFNIFNINDVENLHVQLILDVKEVA